MTDERKEGQSEWVRCHKCSTDFDLTKDTHCPVCAPAQPEPRGSEALREALRKVNDLQHRMAIELDAIPQQPRIEYWTRQMEEVICAALAAATAERTPHVHSSDCYAYPVSGAKKYLICDAADRQSAPPQPEEQLQNFQEWWYSLAQGERDFMDCAWLGYQRGWTAAIEAAAQHVMLPSASAFAFYCSGCEWRVQTEEDVSAAMRSFSAHIRSLRPSPAPQEPKW